MTIYSSPESFIDPTPSAGQRFGSAIGGGLSEGLQLLLQSKLKKMEERERFSKLQSLLGGQSGQLGGQSGQLGGQSGQLGGQSSQQKLLALSDVDPKLAKLVQAQETASGREVASKFKETKDVRKEIINQSKAAKENNLRLDRMNELNEKGELINPLFNASLEKLGLDIAALKNPDSQEFEKLSNDMFKNIREIFGNRINVIEVQTFLKTIPTLMQSSEGKKRVINNLKFLNRSPELRLKAMKDITKENGGVPPYDLGELVEERISPKLDEMASEFISGTTTQRSDKKEISQPSLSTRVRNKKTGEILEWTGTQWKKSK